MNTVIEGNLTEDPKQVGPEVHYNILSKRWVNNEESVKFFLITTQGTLGDVCFKYLKKGSRVLVSGSINGSAMTARDVNFICKK
jgi:single-stranded DNA-binding protein